jgi:hypothetical protein
MQSENRIQRPALAIKLWKYIFLACFWLFAIYWGILTYDIIIEGIIRSPNQLIEGIENRIWHLSSEVAFSTNHDRLLMELSKGYLMYAAVSYLTLFFSFFGLLWKWQKKGISIAKQDKAATNRPGQRTLKWFLYACFFAVTLVWCFYTFRLVDNITKSKYGIENIIRQEAPSLVPKGQPLFVNSEIRGMTFDHAARLISVVYLKYIVLIYLEALLIFLALTTQRNFGKRQSEAEAENRS